ncbi:hypothetical protein [uncultured Vibrio sp.]|uniref:hypothetical protein n=1 Tax=uncultured Vibrio sp. TaxID=114054 RepID=UPI002AAB1D57|nr:hypothetical protein [uncultured Vibrio sp.]
MKKLQWNDEQIPHQIHLDVNGQQSRITMTVVKDVEPEVITLSLNVKLEELQQTWNGVANPVSEAFDDGTLYSQVRCLFNLEQGCVVWMVNHITLPNSTKMSADKLAYLPGLAVRAGKLVTL